MGARGDNLDCFLCTRAGAQINGGKSIYQRVITIKVQFGELWNQSHVCRLPAGEGDGRKKTQMQIINQYFLFESKLKSRQKTSREKRAGVMKKIFPAIWDFLAFFLPFSNFNFHQFRFRAQSFIFYQSGLLGIAYYGVTMGMRRCHTRASQSSFWLMNDLIGLPKHLQLSFSSSLRLPSSCLLSSSDFVIGQNVLPEFESLNGTWTNCK